MKSPELIDHGNGNLNVILSEKTSTGEDILVSVQLNKNNETRQVKGKNIKGNLVVTAFSTDQEYINGLRSDQRNKVILDKKRTLHRKLDRGRVLSPRLLTTYRSISVYPLFLKMSIAILPSRSLTAWLPGSRATARKSWAISAGICWRQKR